MSCSTDPTRTHRFALADSAGWVCQGCRVSGVTYSIRELPGTPLKWLAKPEVPTCDSCKKSDPSVHITAVRLHSGERAVE